MEERLRAIEGGGNYDFADMAELCLVADVVIPPKFKVPDFDKYKGITCPKNHPKMYCRKMGGMRNMKTCCCISFRRFLLGQLLPSILT